MLLVRDLVGRGGRGGPVELEVVMTGSQLVPHQVPPVQARGLALLREDEGGLGEVGDPGLVAVTAPEKEEEAEQEEEEEGGEEGEEGGQQPGGESLALRQVWEAADVVAPERERELTDGPPVLEAGQELHQPGRLTAALQQVAPNLQPAQPRPGQTVRPQDSQAVLAEINRE